jgi:hypothetical protein
MAKVLGFNPQQSYIEMEDTIKLQRSLIEELVRLNEGYEAEVKRLVGEYDKIYELYLMGEQLLKNYDPDKFGYPKFVNKDIMKKKTNNRNIEGIEFIDFSKPKVNE